MSHTTFTSLNVSGVGHPMTKIYDIFRPHIDALMTEESKAYQAIDDWSSGLCSQIREHVLQQRQLLEQFYKTQREDLENMRQQFVDTSIIYERRNDKEEIDRLLDKCKNLKIELMKLEFFACPTEFIKVTPGKLPELMDQDEFNSRKSEKPLIERENTGPVYDKNSNSSSRSTSEIFNQMNQQLPATQSTNVYGLATNNNNINPKTDITADNNSNDKCPVCFMIFPLNMSETSRSMHANEHYKD